MPDLHIVLLAAGESKRMGAPKALLDWKGESLIKYQVKKLRNLKIPISLILGSKSELIAESLKDLDVDVFSNPDWKEGMGKSMAFATEKISQFAPAAILFFLVDQPLIGLEDLNTLIDTHRSNPDKIIVSKSNDGWRGPPVIFPKMFYPKLKALRGDQGGSPIVKNHQKEVMIFKPKSSIEDMDTPDAYERLLALASHQS